MKDKKYYIEIYNRKWDECLKAAETEMKENDYCVDISDVAIEIFDEIANAEEIVGYYIVYHDDCALRDWLDNTNGIIFLDKDKEVDKILKELYQ